MGKYNLFYEEFCDEEDKLTFLDYLSTPDMTLMEMANMRGNDVKLHKQLPFSLFISNKKTVHNSHAIRVKVLWNPNKMTSTPDGQLELHGNYNYEKYAHKYEPTSKELNELINYCKKYKVFLSAIWECVLDANDFIDYQRGTIGFKELLSYFDLGERNYYDVNHCESIEELEGVVRKNKIFNMND